MDTTLIENDAITTAKIAAGAVTANLIAASAVTAGKIAANAVTATTIAAGAVTAAKIDVAQLSALAADLGTITAGQIRNGGNTVGIRISGSRPSTWQNYLDLLATGDQPFLQHGMLTLNADGSGSFGDALLSLLYVGL